MEIERKFKVLKLPDNIEKYEKTEIEQGYLCIKPTVRIRKNGDMYTLNYKWKDKNTVEQKAIQNIEYEMPLTKENYKHLVSKADNNMLIFSEVEFKNLNDSENFKKPEWMGKDISFDKRYDNTLLSKIDKYDEKYFK